MSSFWIEQQARQRIDEFAADARGDQLIRDAGTPAARQPTIGGVRRVSLRSRAWMDAVVARSRRPLARER